MPSYLVWVYQYNDMSRPKWNARRYREGKDRRATLDTLPPTVIAVFDIGAKDKPNALRIGKHLYESGYRK